MKQDFFDDGKRSKRDRGGGISAINILIGKVQVKRLALRSQKQLISRGQNPSRLTFLRSVKKCSVLGRVADFDDFGAGEELHDHAGSDDGRNSQLHQSSSIRSQDDSHPIKRIRRVR